MRLKNRKFIFLILILTLIFIRYTVKINYTIQDNVIKSNKKMENSEILSLIWSKEIQNPSSMPTSYNPMIADIDLDGKLEVIARSSNFIVALNGEDGSTLWNVTINDTSSEVVGDIDLDGKLEVIARSSNFIVALNGEDGSTLWNVSNSYNIEDLVIGDIDSDGKLEVIGGGGDSIVVLNGEDGSTLWTKDIPGAKLALGDR